MLAKRFSATKLESETAGIAASFDEEIGVNAWRPTLQLQKREGSSTFHIPIGKMSQHSYFKKCMQDMSDTMSPKERQHMPFQRKLDL